MKVFILVDEDIDEPVETESAEGIPEGDDTAEQLEGETTEQETGQEEESVNTVDNRSVETVDYSDQMQSIQDSLDEITGYSFASCLLLSLIFLFLVVRSLFSGFR